MLLVFKFLLIIQAFDIVRTGKAGTAVFKLRTKKNLIKFQSNQFLIAEQEKSTSF